MTPTNDPNGKPLIYRIADALGVFHLVAPVKHTHTISEITDIENYTPSGIQGGTSGNEAYILIGANGAIAGTTKTGFAIDLIVNGQHKIFEVSSNTIENLLRAQSDPDAQPIDESDNLITSGAVYAALNSAIRMKRSTNIPDFNVALLEKGIIYNYIFFNNSGEEISLLSCFDISSLPVSERNLYITENGDGVTIGDGEQFGARLCRLDDGVFVEFSGLFV